MKNVATVAAIAVLPHEPADGERRDHGASREQVGDRPPIEHQLRPGHEDQERDAGRDRGSARHLGRPLPHDPVRPQAEERRAVQDAEEDEREAREQ